jgi:hypothetical protein
MQEKIKLMIVDDSAIIRQAIHKHLKISILRWLETRRMQNRNGSFRTSDVVTLDITMRDEWIDSSGGNAQNRQKR